MWRPMYLYEMNASQNQYPVHWYPILAITARSIRAMGFMKNISIQAWVRCVNAIGVFYLSTFKFAVLPDADRDAIRDGWFSHFGNQLELHHFMWDTLREVQHEQGN